MSRLISTGLQPGVVDATGRKRF